MSTHLSIKGLYLNVVKLFLTKIIRLIWVEEYFFRFSFETCLMLCLKTSLLTSVNKRFYLLQWTSNEQAAWWLWLGLFEYCYIIYQSIKCHLQQIYRILTVQFCLNNFGYVLSGISVLHCCCILSNMIYSKRWLPCNCQWQDYNSKLVQDIQPKFSIVDTLSSWWLSGSNE